MMQNKKKSILFVITSFMMIFLFVMAPLQVAATKTEEKTTLSENDLYAQAAVLMDADSGRILFGKNSEEVLANASTTKILTCIIALENGNLEDYVAVSAYAACMPKVHLGMREGQFFKLEDLLYSLMLESHNDSAVAIAEHIAGSVEQFAVMMNQKARDIGCFNSFFITPNGLDATTEDKFHSTTAADLAKIMSYCVSKSPQKEAFLQITGTRSYAFTDYKENGEAGGSSYACNNHNAFLSMMEGAFSGKTGFTGRAGYCYVGALEQDGRTFVIALLACGWPGNKGYKWKDARKLFEYGLTNYQYEYIYEQVKTEEIQVTGGLPYANNQIATKIMGADENWKLLLSQQDKISKKVAQKKELQAPVKKGQIVGEVSYYLNGEILRTFYIETTASAEENSYKWALQYIVKKISKIF